MERAVVFFHKHISSIVYKSVLICYNKLDLFRKSVKKGAAEVKRVSKYMVFALIILLTVAPIMTTYGLEQSDSQSEDYSVFPSALQEIEDEAFENTALEVAVFPIGLRTIGYRSLSNVDSLSYLYIPNSVSCIDATAFEGDSRLVIRGIEGSYVQKWAQMYDIPFEIEDIWTEAQPSASINIESLLFLFSLILPDDLKLFEKEVGKTAQYLRSMRPQDRPELYPINYRFP